MASIIETNPHVLDPSEYACDDEDIDTLEQLLGRPIPDQLASFLKLSDGGLLRGPHLALQMADIETLGLWADRGVMDELESIPFAHTDEGAVLVIDEDGQWGGPAGAVYRVANSRSHVGRIPVRNAVRLAGSLSGLLQIMADGRDPW